MSDLDVINEIKKIIGRKLKPCPPDADIMDFDQQGCYLLNEQQQVTGLNLQFCELTNCDFLKALLNLTQLDLTYNQISNLSVLKELPNLTELNLNNNQISNLSVLKELPNLTELNLAYNRISDLSVLKALPNLTKLNLSGNKLSYISVLKTLPNLTKLNLSDNKISNLSVLKALPNLTQLNLSHNKLSYISVLKDLHNLTELNLSNNQISNLSVLKDLHNLTKLNLNENQISNISDLKDLPNLTELNLNENKISNIRVLKDLPNLTKLDLNNNQISDISVLKALPNLTKLDLNRNKINDISVLKELKKLAILSLAANKISNIEALKKLNNITTLCLGNNQLKIFPEWLLQLNLEIKFEYSEYCLWTDENGIFVEINPIEQPPLEIIIQGNEAIRAFFEQIRKEGFDTIYEAKLILVGEGGAGKTSLANKIINPAWQLIPEIKSESTKGIDILSYQFPYKDKNFRVNIWDFGGQQIYHQTHQFFLSKRALYFLLTDDRKEDTDFYHWLNIVDLLSANSPVLIIKNEKNNRSRDIPEQELKEFNNIKDILATNLSDNRGLPEIVKALQYYITDLPHIGSPLPKTWIKVRENLEQLVEKKKNWIDLKEYFEICQINGFEKEADKLQLSEYLHDLGVCLHFQHDPKSLLYKMLILKPTWATDAVYKVLDNDTVKNQAGHFTDKDLADIWQDEQYNTMRGELLALMQKFKLCYEIPRKPLHYIAPQLLKDKAPQYNWQANDLLLLRYKYDFMPKGILSQFIVEMHEHIANNYQWVWKSGVILEKDNTQAEIIEYYGRREIHIRVHGNNKKELLNIVSYELDKINSSYERLKDKCKKLIPCNCERCFNISEPYFYPEDVLKRFRIDRQPDIQCQISYKMVRVLGLIDDVDMPYFGKEKEDSDQQVQFNVTINQGKNMNNDNSRHQSFNGTATNANVNFGDNSTQTNTVNNQGMSKEEFLQLLQTFKQDLSKSSLPDDTVEEVVSDVEAVEKQLQKTEPNKSIVSRKLESINGVLEDANSSIDTATKGYETFNKIVQAGKILLGGIGFLG